MKTIKISITSIVIAISMCSQVFAGTYMSELSGKDISDTIKDQRPVAIMIDNEKQALPHYGVSEADIVYEMINSTANDRITRLMCLYKDWGSIPRIGSVRSVRPTHIPLAGEYDAMLIHEGGPELYIKEPLSKGYVGDLNGGFSRLQNGKSKEFTEFVLEGEVISHAKKANVPTKYTRTLERNTHFRYYKADNKLSEKYTRVKTANSINLSSAFKHTKTHLEYNDVTDTYDYYVYDFLQKDEEDSATITFKNVIVQFAPAYQLDENGYMYYEVEGAGKGYYFTNGERISIKWQKDSPLGITKYYDKMGNEIDLNKGNTYIAIIPDSYGIGIK